MIAFGANLRQTTTQNPKKESKMLNQQDERVLTRMGARELTSDELAKVSGGVGGTGCQLTGSPRTFQDIICDCPGC
jgi:hypothetical protein